MSVGAVVDAVIADFAEILLLDVVAASRKFAGIRAGVVVDGVSVVAFFAGIDNAVAAPDDTAEFTGFASGFRAIFIDGLAVFIDVAFFVFVELFIAACRDFAVFAPLFLVVAAFASLNFAVAAIGRALAFDTTFIDGGHVVDMVFDIAFFGTGDDAVAALGGACADAHFDKAGQREDEV